MNILYTNFHLYYGGGHDTYLKNLAKITQANIYIACPASSQLYKTLQQINRQTYPQFKELYPIEFPSKLSELKQLCHSVMTVKKIIEEQQQPQLKVIIVGCPPTQQNIQQLVKKPPNCAVIWTGFCPTPEHYLQQGDIGFVLSDGCDTISFACREMMACGLPVIVSNFAGLPENIEDNVDGWITPVADVPSLAQLLQQIIRMPQATIDNMAIHAR